MKEAIRHIADKFSLSDEWLNDDFLKTKLIRPI